MNLAAGATLQHGKYVVQSVLSQTDVGTVYHATHAFLDQPVMIQSLNPALLERQDGDQLKQQFMAAVRRLARCQHPHFVRALDSFEENQIPFLVLGHTPGRTLDQVLQMEPPCSPATALAYTRQIGSALSTLHQQGLSHQNVKPKNIVVRQGSDEVVLIGFNVLRQVVLPIVPSPDAAANHPAPTPAYPSPVADIQGLAAIFYRLLTGQLGALPTSQPDLLRDLSQQHPQLSVAVGQAIWQGLQPDAQLNPPHIDQWLLLLRDRDVMPLPAAEAGDIGAAILALDMPPPVSLSSINVQDSHQADGIANGATNGVAVLTEQPDMAAVTAMHTQVVARGGKSSLKVTERSPKRTRSFPWVPLTLGFTSIVAGLAGAGYVMALRLEQPQTVNGVPRIGGDLFKNEQAFPPLDDWPAAESYSLPPAVRMPVERRELVVPDQAPPEYIPEPDNITVEDAPLAPEPDLLDKVAPISGPLDPLDANEVPLPLDSPVEPIKPVDPAPLPESGVNRLPNSSVAPDSIPSTSAQSQRNTPEPFSAVDSPRTDL